MGSSPFRFTDLPGEIRNKLYKLLLCNFDEPKGYNQEKFLVVPEELTIQGHNLDTAILRVNRQIHGEAKDVFVKTCRFVRLMWNLRPQKLQAMHKAIVTKRLPTIPADREVLDRFRGCVMTYSLSEPKNYKGNKSRFDCLVLHRDLDLVCKSLANADVNFSGFTANTKHSLTLHDPLEDPAKQYPSTEEQRDLLAPFRKLRGLTLVSIQGQIDASLTTEVIALVKTPSKTDAQSILEELRLKNQLGREYFDKDDRKMASENWASACLQIQRMRGSAAWSNLKKSRPFVNQIAQLFFDLNLNLAANNIKAMEETLGDEDMVSGLANSGLRALQSSLQAPEFDGTNWEPTMEQFAEVFRRKSKIHRLEKDYPQASQAIKIAEQAYPNDARNAEERRAVDQMRAS